MVVSFIESDFTTKVEYDKWVAGGADSASAPAKSAAPGKAAAPAVATPVSNGHPLCTVTDAADVPAEFAALAKTWPLWDSKTHPQKPKNSGKFRFDYNGTYHSERVLIMSGAATLKPTDGSAAIQIKAGDRVIFWNGFSCNWHVTTRMTKHYSYYTADGQPEGDDYEEEEEDPEPVKAAPKKRGKAPAKGSSAKKAKK